MSELKPCPFCGGKSHHNAKPFDYSVTIECLNCTVDTLMSVDEWNTRPLEDELRRKLAVATKALSGISTSCEGSYYDCAEGVVNEMIAEAQEALREIGGDHE